MFKSVQKILRSILGKEKHQELIQVKRQNKTKVYFVSGMSCSCSCFDDLTLPEGFEKIYIEWLIPHKEELFIDYCKRMASSIDLDTPFILIGYSLGGYVVQKIAEFASPQQVIIISSIKNEEEVPKLFRLAKKIKFADIIPSKLYNSSDFVFNLFNKYIYTTPAKSVVSFLNITDPIYIKWALKNVYESIPDSKIDNLTHIHGTRDQIFPFELIGECISIKGGDHLMVVKRSIQINKVINKILSKSY